VNEVQNDHSRPQLRRSIDRTVIAYIALQHGLFCAFALPGGFFNELFLSFSLSSLAFHVVLYALLRYFIDDFKNEATGDLFPSMNLANRITLMRISTLPTLFFLVVAARTYRIRYPLLILVVLIFITDFLDGYVSRKAHQVTKIGRMMDSASDYSVLIVLTLVFRYYSLIPTWFLLLVLARLGIQVVFTAALIAINKRIEPRTTFMGKAAIASIMVVYSVEVLGLIAGGLPSILKTSVEWIVAAIVMASIVDKVVSFASCLRTRGKGL
jgi:phosphatidylglycerophosphate synthase